MNNYEAGLLIKEIAWLAQNGGDFLVVTLPFKQMAAKDVGAH